MRAKRRPKDEAAALRENHVVRPATSQCTLRSRVLDAPPVESPIDAPGHDIYGITLVVVAILNRGQDHREFTVKLVEVLLVKRNTSREDLIHQRQIKLPENRNP